jgi:ribose 5-phosphate isomerase B
MKLVIGADHAGFELKEHLLQILREAGHEVRDVGTDSTASVDYPDFAELVACEVATGRAERGVLVCATGTGMAMAANKIPGIRAAACNDLYLATFARAHNDCNVLALGARVVGSGYAEQILQAFLITPFEEGRHQRRVDKVGALEKNGGRCAR